MASRMRSARGGGGLMMPFSIRSMTCMAHMRCSQQGRICSNLQHQQRMCQIVARYDCVLCSQLPQSMAHNSGAWSQDRPSTSPCAGAPSSCHGHPWAACEQPRLLSFAHIDCYEMSSSNMPAINALDLKATIQATGCDCHLKMPSIARTLCRYTDYTCCSALCVTLPYTPTSYISQTIRARGST